MIRSLRFGAQVASLAASLSAIPPSFLAVRTLASIGAVGRAVAVVNLIVWTAGGRPAGAAPDKAEDLIRRALEMRRTGDDQGAQALFREAYDISHAPRAAAQLGFCEQALGRWAEAETHLAESLRGGNDSWVKKNRPTIEQALLLVKSRIARLEISGDPAGAEVLVNGNVVGQLPLSAPVRIAGGDIEVELRAPGHVAVTKRLRIEGGQYQKLSLRATKEASPVTAVVPPQWGGTPPKGSSMEIPTADVSPSITKPDETTPSESPSRDDSNRGGSSPLRRSLKFVGWGLAVAGLGVGVYGVLQNSSLVKEFDSGCGKDPSGTPQVAPGAPAGFTTDRCKKLESRYDSAATLGLVGFVGAAVFAGAGFALWLTESPHNEAQNVAWRCLPQLTAAGVPAVGCVGRF